MTATIDVLGEEIHNAEEAQEIVDAYHDTLDAIGEHSLDANVSIKPTAVGLKLGYDVGRRTSRRSCAMRRRPTTSCASTWRTRPRRTTRSACTGSCGRQGSTTSASCFQARLRRTLDDIAALADLRPNVRICKGIYLEPEAIAFTDFEEIRASYVRSLEALIETASYVGIATHDEFLISEGKRIAR